VHYLRLHERVHLENLAPVGRHRLTIIIKNCQVIDCGTGISAPQGTPLQVTGTTFVRTGTVLEVRDAPSSFEEARDWLLRALPEGATWDEIREAFGQITASSQAERQQSASKTTIASRLLAVGKWSLENVSQFVAIAEYFERRGWL
jgi:hypothetical protein